MKRPRARKQELTVAPTPKICAMPFTQLALRENGDAIPCCLREDYVVGNALEQPLSALWNSEKMQALRREFLSGKIKTCKEDIAHHRCPRWTEHLLGGIEKSVKLSKPPIRLDLRMNGRCNLECVMCEEWKKPNGVYDRSGFWEEAGRDIFPGLAEIEVLGGEPFIQKDTFRLIDEISSVNPRCRWLFNTNGMWAFNAKIKHSLDKIRLERIGFSIDSLEPARFAKIRNRGDLAKALLALDRTIAYRDERVARGKEGFDIALVATLQRENYLEIAKMLEFCLDKKIIFAVIFLKKPEHLSLLSLGDSERQGLVPYFQSFLREIRRAGIGTIRTAGFEDVILSLIASLPPARRLQLYSENHAVR